MTMWDDGIRWHLEQVEGPDFDYDLPLLPEIREQHLRVTGGGLEDEWIARAWKTTYRAAERVTRRALIPQTWAQVMDRFPSGSGQIVVQKAPLISVTSITYIDEDGVEQTLSGSPAEFTVLEPSGPKAGKAEIFPLYDTTWPSTRRVPDAVTVTFTCGYVLVDGLASIPEDITHGRLLMLGELYKQRSLSVHAFNQNPALIQAADIWKEYRNF